jgi:hypothetical protein
MAHPLKHLPLKLTYRAKSLAEEKLAIPGDRSQRRPKIMDCPRQEIGSIVIVLLQPQIRENQALQGFVTVRTAETVG